MCGELFNKLFGELLTMLDKYGLLRCNHALLSQYYTTRKYVESDKSFKYCMYGAKIYADW